MEPTSKSARVLQIYARLVSGEVLKRKDLASEYGVTERSIQRDIDTLREYLDRNDAGQEVFFNHGLAGYQLLNRKQIGLTNDEALAVCKILLESRSMTEKEMFPIIDKIIEYAVPAACKQDIKALVANEKYHYIEPHHNRSLLKCMWDIGQAVEHHNEIIIEYERLKNHEVVKRKVQPVGIMFSEYYFYLTAFLENRETFDNPDDLFPTIYRIDRIRSVEVLNQHFYVPYKDRFEEGEFRKRVQFMYGGYLQLINFKYTGPSVEAVLDRLPTARIKSQDGDTFEIEAEVFGKGYEMWARSQGDYIQDLSVRKI